MKNRRLSIFVFLMIAMATLGIGYAALSDSFTIYGDLGANVDNSNLVVVFDSDSTADGTYANIDGNIDGLTSAEITFSNMTTKGQVATANLVVENRSTNGGAELTATLSDPVVTATGIDATVFKITAAWANNDLTIAPTESNTIVITVELLKTPTASIDAKSFSVTFTATTD